MLTFIELPLIVPLIPTKIVKHEPILQQVCPNTFDQLSQYIISYQDIGQIQIFRIQRAGLNDYLKRFSHALHAEINLIKYRTCMLIFYH